LAAVVAADVAAYGRLMRVNDERTLTDLENAIHQAATRAWRIAQDSDGDPLLELLREHGSATTIELATALGKPTTAVLLALRPLIAEGLVHRTGHAKSSRYHA